MTLRLKSVEIQNFKSLRDVCLNFRDLTILVGSNSSGKSNSLGALSFLRNLLVRESLPGIEVMQEVLNSSSTPIVYNINVEDDNNQAKYSLALRSIERKTLLASENLKVNGIEVIKIVNGQGQVTDEDGNNPQKYESDPESIEGLALRWAGNIGNKPFTKKLASYIKEWKIYDIDPDLIRQSSFFEINTIIGQQRNSRESIPSLDTQASEVQEILNYWSKNDQNKLQLVSQDLKDCLNINLTFTEDKNKFVKVLEADGKEMPLFNMSDGTLRLIAYFILLYQSDIPPLIGIEEPERNLHPGILKDVASIMKRLSQKTQVVFTTHSSQLLDCFNSEEISSDISVILLSKKDESGTKACLLDKLAENREDLLEWINDFGLGSAIYHSHLIEGILGN